jgi:DNA-binding YbaB/EbfC family protein
VTTEGPEPDLGGLFAQLGQMQQQLQAAQESATSAAIEGTAGGGAVTITGSGGLDVTGVTIDPEIVDPADVEMLQDLVLAAIRDLIEQAQSLQSQAMGGFDLGGGLEGLLGG